MADVQWIKLYIDMFDKRKIKKVRRLPAGNDLLLIWIMLLAMAGKCNAGGMIYITESVPFTEEDLADELDFEIGTIKLALQAFENLNMITTSDDGFIEVIGWEEYQNVDRLSEIREYNRIAQQRSRERRKALKAASEDTSEDVNDMSLTCQRCHDIEEEEELEEDKEKEIHSFNHSIAQGEDEFSTEFSTEHDPEDNPKMEYMRGKLGEGVVFMSEEQFHSLLDILSLDEVHKYFKIIVDCEKQGKHFTKKTHYQAILDMAMKDRAVKRKGV